jgi:adenosylcobinamide-GDP ribazoletransferase
MLSFLTAVKFLTVVPWPRGREVTPEGVAESASFFPVVGLLLGLILFFVDRLLDPYLASEILSVVLVTTLILITRATDLEALAETWDRLGAKRDEKASQPSGRSLRLGVCGLLAVLVTVALKFRAIEVMGEARGPGLLLAPVLGRWAMVVLAYGSTPLSAGENQTLMEHVRGKQLVLATTITLVVVSLFARRLGLLIALWVSLLALLSRQFLHRRLGGVSEDHLGAIGEMSEALALVLFATL